MKSLGAVEISALCLAAVVIVVGVHSMIHPAKIVLFQPSHGGIGVPPDPPPMEVSQRGVRIYGMVSIGVGAGIGLFVLYRPRK